MVNKAIIIIAAIAIMVQLSLHQPWCRTLNVLEATLEALSIIYTMPVVVLKQVRRIHTNGSIKYLSLSTQYGTTQLVRFNNLDVYVYIGLYKSLWLYYKHI